MGHPAKRIDIIHHSLNIKKRKKKNNLSLYHEPNEKTSLKDKPRKPKYFAYIVVRDKGFAPNPFYGFCTLAHCKPTIRKVAKEEDWIIGFYSRAKSVPQNIRGKLVYAMKVKERITFNEYWNDQRFSKKKHSGKISRRRWGDNICYEDLKGNWVQVENLCHKEAEKGLDTRVNAVLISDKFFYFGRKDVSIPRSIKESINKSWQQKGYKISIDQSWRNHKYLDKESGKALIAWLEKKGEVRHGDPIGPDNSIRHKKNTRRCGTKKSHR